MLFLMLLLLGSGIFMVVIAGFIGPFQDGRIFNTLHSLDVARESVQWYRVQTGMWPRSLGEIRTYALEKGVDFHRPGVNVSTGTIFLFLSDFDREWISRLRGNSTEWDVLNNKGGFYYNKHTGEVKINLTQPLKDYFIIFFGERGDEIPADW